MKEIKKEILRGKEVNEKEIKHNKGMNKIRKYKERKNENIRKIRKIKEMNTQK